MASQLLRKIKQLHSPILPANGGEKRPDLPPLSGKKSQHFVVLVTEYLLFVFPCLAVACPLMLSILAEGLLSRALTGEKRMKTALQIY